MKTAYKLLIISSVLLPLILVPFAAHKGDSPYFLLGIAFCYIGAWCVLTALDLLVVFATAGILYVWFSMGYNLFDYTTFYFLCLLGGYLLAKLAVRFKKLSEAVSVID